MDKILAALRDILASFRWVTRQVWDGSKFIAQASMEYVVQPAVDAATWTYDNVALPGAKAAAYVARPALKVAEGAIGVTAAVCRPVVSATSTVGRGAWNLVGKPAVALVDGVLGLPGRILSGGGRGSGSGPDAAQAQAQAAAQVKQAEAQVEKALSAGQQATLLQRAARRRCDEKAVDGLIEALGQLGPYVQALTLLECERLGALDARAVTAWIAGDRPSLPGIRTPAEVLGGAPLRHTSAAPETVPMATPMPQLRARYLAMKAAEAAEQSAPEDVNEMFNKVILRRD